MPIQRAFLKQVAVCVSLFGKKWTIPPNEDGRSDLIDADTK
jgi:hypothetical protein